MPRSGAASPSGRASHPDLHTILDTGMFLLSGLLALWLWDIGARSSQPLPRWLAVSFALTSLSEFVHALASLEWSGFLAPISEAADAWRPGTWPPAAYLLPIGIGCSVWLVRRDGHRVTGLALALIALTGSLFTIFHWLPRYSLPTVLGITRPMLILPPLLWTLVGLACWTLRASDRMFSALAVMAAALLVANVSMLYSRSPHDAPAMVAHLGKVGGYLTLLLALMQMASFDMLERVRSERKLAQLNEQLEVRVLERTAQLGSTNTALEREIAIRAEAESALHESQDRLTAIIGSATDAIITVDSDQHILLFNSAAERMFGCLAAEAVGQPITRFIPQRFHAAHAGHIRKFGETGVNNRAMGPMKSLWAVRANGEEFQIEASISQIVTGGKKLFTVILRDVTERKQAEEVRERLAAVVESSDDAIISKTLDGFITAWNPGAQKLFGYSSSEAMGKSMRMLLPPERANEESDLLVKVRQGQSVDHFETVRIRKDGKKIDISATISPIRDSNGAIVGASKIARDITERKRAEEALRESENHLNGILQSATDSIITVDGQQRIVLFNATAEKVFRCPAKEALGQPIERFVPQRFRSAHAAHIGHFGKTGVTNRTMGALSALWAVRADGEEFQIEASISQVESSGKKLFTVILRDVTERKQAEEKLVTQAEELVRQAEELTRSQQALEAQSRMMQSVLDSMAEGLVAADEQGQFIIWNPAAERILGLGAANLPTPQWSEHYGLFLDDRVTPFPPDQLPLVRAIRGEASTAQIFVRNPELAEGVWIEASGGPLMDKAGIVRGGVVAFRDITQKRSSEHEIQRLNSELELRVAERTAQLEEANKELESFTYSVAHDLRAPLRHIAGFSGILVEEFSPVLNAEAQRYLGRIQEGTQRMGRLVDELLTLAKVGRQPLNLQIAGLNSIVQEVIGMLQPDVEGRQVEWKIADLPFVECDPGLLRQVFQNLISNALKYSRPRSHAVIEIGQILQNEQSVVFVRDNGVGFSMKYADKLFGVFQRLHRSEDFEGTGVGLATVQRIIKKHQGKVWGEAELDKGATFYFTLGGLQPAEAKKETMALGAGL